MVDFIPEDRTDVFGLVKDATRLGNPGKDIEIVHFGRVKGNKSAWLLCQDSDAHDKLRLAFATNLLCI